MFNALRRSVVRRPCHLDLHLPLLRAFSPTPRFDIPADSASSCVEPRRSHSTSASNNIPGLVRTASTASIPTTFNTPPPSMAMARPTSSFYMRQLPSDKLVGYETPEGKALFKQGLQEGNLEAFFPLSQQFLTVCKSPVVEHHARNVNI